MLCKYLQEVTNLKKRVSPHVASMDEGGRCVGIWGELIELRHVENMGWDACLHGFIYGLERVFLYKSIVQS
jgi:hypothetical protein